MIKALRRIVAPAAVVVALLLTGNGVGVARADTWYYYQTQGTFLGCLRVGQQGMAEGRWVRFYCRQNARVSTFYDVMVSYDACPTCLKGKDES